MSLRVNGETIALADSQAQRNDRSFSWEVEGRETAEYILTELDQADPAGRYRLRVTGDALQIERAKLAEWVDSFTFVKVTGDGVDLVAFSEDGLADLLERLLLGMENGGGVGVLAKQVVETALLL